MSASQSKRLQRAALRAARLAEAQAQQRREQQRRGRVLVQILALGIVGLLVPTAVVLVIALRQKAAVEAAAGSPIAGEQVMKIADTAHTSASVDYDLESAATPPAGTLPPTGGDHDPAWQPCGIYDTPVRTENAVHSLEHGAVWIAYNPSLPEGQVEDLADVADAHPYVLLSPIPDLAAPVVLSAWGVQLQLPSSADPRVEPFLTRYLQGPQSPELGAACSGDVSE
ncbi:DUF3105 domain-containing protein [Cellulomonas marina]|uniref:DUF3105 domain-containing protein n=1 Tax=Cellulomonas marina TaxID=988821 RepID=A0A1I0YXW8_9CELL|nr:DUF3105 domain-containing protein [Cellulomonas marina]GIG28101.1 membrane protein [Cellulomonas marina]SFB18215.1 Protein of unknown function [Cellulomonas marina]